jgi:hypothetical protein
MILNPESSPIYQNNRLFFQAQSMSTEDLRREVEEYETISQQRAQMSFLGKIKDFFLRGPLVSRDIYLVQKQVLSTR